MAKKRSKRARSLAAKKGWETRRAREAERAKAARRKARKPKAEPTVVPLTARERKQIPEQRRLAKAEQARLKRLHTVDLAPDDYDPDDYEDEDVELAELYGVHPAEVEAFKETLDIEQFNPASEEWNYEGLADYIDDLAEELDVDEAELWDIWWTGVYGGTRDTT